MTDDRPLIRHAVKGSAVLSESAAYLVVRRLAVAQADPARCAQRSLRLPLCCLTAELCGKRTAHRGFYAEVCNLLVNSTSVPAAQLRPLVARRSSGSASRGRRPSPRDVDWTPPGVQNPSGRLLRQGQHSSTLQNPVSCAGHNGPLPTGQHRTSSFSQALETLLRIISGHRDLQSSTPTRGRGRGGGAKRARRVSDSLKAEEGGPRGSELGPAQQGTHLSTQTPFFVGNTSHDSLLPSL